VPEFSATIANSEHAWRRVRELRHADGTGRYSGADLVLLPTDFVRNPDRRQI
jgi:hypothetical protein